MRVIALNINMLLLCCLRRFLGHLRHHLLFAFALHHVDVLRLLFFLLWCTDYLSHFRVTLEVYMFLHVLLHSNMRGGILSCGLHLLSDILVVTVVMWNIAFE